MSSPEGERNFWDYEPSKPAAYIFAVLYTIPAVYTLYQYISLRCWFWIFMVIAAIMEAVGYIGRVVSVHNQTVLAPYLIQFMCIFLAPAIIAASCYMAMGRVVLHVTPPKYRTIKKLWVTPRWMTPIFVGCDVIAFLIQVLGASRVTSTTPSVVKTAFMTMKIGLGVQLACFGLFIVIAVRFHFVSQQFRAQWPDQEWPKFLWAINFAALLIFIRSIYRMIEFTQGNGGYLLTHEWTFYLFESVIMLPTIIVFNIYHPAHYVSNIGFRQKRGAENIASDTESAASVHLNERSAIPSRRTRD